MATDWSDPEQVERELRRREKELSGDDSRSDMRLLLGAMLAVLKTQKQTATQTATLAEDIATLRGLLARLEEARSAVRQPEAESGLATRLAEAEGRIAGHVDNLAERVRPLAAAPKALEDLQAAVGPLAEAVRAQTRAVEASTSYLNTMSVELKDMVRDADLGMRHRFAEEANGVRAALNGTTAVVLKRRRHARMFRLRIAGGVLLGLLLCVGLGVGLGVWLQSKHELVEAHDPTGGWRDYIWQQYGSAILDCKREAQEAERQVDCRLPVTPPRR